MSHPETFWTERKRLQGSWVELADSNRRLLGAMPGIDRPGLPGTDCRRAVASGCADPRSGRGAACSAGSSLNG